MSGRAGKGASASGSRGIPSGGKRRIDNSKHTQESIARAARVQSRSGSSGKGDGLSEAAAAAASLKPNQPQVETETEPSPIKRQRVQARGGSRVRVVANSEDEISEDEISVSGAATTSEEQGRNKLRKCAHIPVQKFKMHSSNIIIVKQLRRIYRSEINSNVARFAGWNIVAVHAPGPAPNFEGSN
jgi:hypothetical protein